MGEPHDDMSPEELIAAMRAAGDQAAASTGEIAKIVVAYRKELLEGGIPESEIPALVVAFQTELIRSGQQ